MYCTVNQTNVHMSFTSLIKPTLQALNQKPQPISQMFRLNRNLEQTSKPCDIQLRHCGFKFFWKCACKPWFLIYVKEASAWPNPEPNSTKSLKNPNNLLGLIQNPNFVWLIRKVCLIDSWANLKNMGGQILGYNSCPCSIFLYLRM